MLSWHSFPRQCKKSAAVHKSASLDRQGIPESVMRPVLQKLQRWDEPKCCPLRHVEIINEGNQPLATNGGQNSLQNPSKVRMSIFDMHSKAV